MSSDGFLPAAVFVEQDLDDEFEDEAGPGEGIEEHAYFGRKGKKAAEIEIDPKKLQASLDDITDKLTQVLANQKARGPDGFELESFSVGLALSATGKLLMIAEAGVEASVELSFTRK